MAIAALVFVLATNAFAEPANSESYDDYRIVRKDCSAKYNDLCGQAVKLAKKVSGPAWCAVAITPNVSGKLQSCGVGAAWGSRTRQEAIATALSWCRKTASSSAKRLPAKYCRLLKVTKAR